MPGKGRGHGWGGRGASRRAVRFVEPILLLLLQHGPAHGYPLIEQLSEYGLTDVDSSSVYRALRDMEKRGWVTSSWEKEETDGPPRRVYHLTALGDEMLSWWTQDLQETRDMIDHFLGAYSRHMEGGMGEHH